MCTKSKSQKIYAKFINHCQEIDPSLSAEKIIHMDISGERQEIYAIGWCLATLTEAHYLKKSDNNSNETNNLKINLTSNLTTFKFLKRDCYAKTLYLIESLLNT